MIVCRPATPEDRVFILSTWIDSFRESPWCPPVAFDRMYKLFWNEFAAHLDRPNCATFVAEDQLLLGFIAGDVSVRPPLVFYVNVKAPYRRRGIATKLFAALNINPRLPFDYAFKTQKVVDLERKIPHAQHQYNILKFPEGQGYRR